LDHLKKVKIRRDHKNREERKMKRTRRRNGPDGTTKEERGNWIFGRKNDSSNPPSLPFPSQIGFSFPLATNLLAAEKNVWAGKNHGETAGKKGEGGRGEGIWGNHE
jgi:hypothetical protein